MTDQQQEERTAFIQGLRELLVLYERSSTLRAPAAPLEGYIFCYSREEFGAQVQALGKGEKSADTTYLNVTRACGSAIKLQVTACRKQICTRRVIGSRKVQKQVPVQFETQEVDEEIVQWDCPESFLLMKEQVG